MIKVELPVLKKHFKTAPFDIYEKNDSGKLIFLAKKDTPLAKIKASELFIEKENKNEYRVVISEQLKELSTEFEEVIKNSSSSLDDISDALYSYADLLMEDILSDPEDLRRIKETKKFLSLVIDTVTLNLSFVDLLKSTTSLEKFFIRRSVNSAIITCAFLQVLAMKNKDITPLEVLNASQGALLKDIGMHLLSKEIITKSGAFTPEEVEIIKAHPKLGYDILKSENPIISELGMNVILDHHERIDGSGYPSGKTGKDLSFFSKAVAICDVYCALTSDRFDRKKLTVQEATIYMKNNFENLLDKDLLKYFYILCGAKNLIEDNLNKI